MWLHVAIGWSVLGAAAGTALEVIVFRGLVDVGSRWLIPRPSLLNSGDDEHREDAVARRRTWFWRVWLFRLFWAGAAGFALSALLGSAGIHPSALLNTSTAVQLVVQMLLLFLINFGILFGPFLLMAVSQIHAYEPGDADWGVRLDEVRGQAEAKEEVRRVVTLWQSGEASSGPAASVSAACSCWGRRERARRCCPRRSRPAQLPVRLDPGSGFAGMFLGMDAITVRLLAFRAKRLAAKWGGQCIVFIDEIDAVG
ncbi:MAG TPA: hypothetical protein VMU66_02310, partial [Gaiellales bacterium]|nr:hypothetical protein [Gaiellales bacterium]